MPNSTFELLAAELRNDIYKYTLKQDGPITIYSHKPRHFDTQELEQALALTRVCKTSRQDSTAMFWHVNEFRLHITHDQVIPTINRFIKKIESLDVASIPNLTVFWNSSEGHHRPKTSLAWWQFVILKFIHCATRSTVLQDFLASGKKVDIHVQMDDIRLVNDPEDFGINLTFDLDCEDIEGSIQTICAMLMRCMADPETRHSPVGMFWAVFLRLAKFAQDKEYEAYRKSQAAEERKWKEAQEKQAQEMQSQEKGQEWKEA